MSAAYGCAFVVASQCATPQVEQLARDVQRQQGVTISMSHSRTCAPDVLISLVAQCAGAGIKALRPFLLTEAC